MEFPYSYKFCNSYDNQYNPFDFTSNSYRYFNDNYCINDSNCVPQNFQDNDEPLSLEKQVESLLYLSIQQKQRITKLCNSYKCNNSSQEFQTAPQNFQNNNHPSALEKQMKSLLKLSIQQNQRITDLYNSYVCSNSSQGLQNNQNCNLLQNSNHFDYNPCQHNFELQN